MIAVRPLLFTRSGSVSYGFSGHWLRSFHLWSVDALMFRAFGEQGLAQIHTPQRVVMRGAPKTVTRDCLEASARMTQARKERKDW